VQLLNGLTENILVSHSPTIVEFHGAFYHGNWKALHHHAACSLVNIHIIRPFVLQLP